MNKKQKSRLIWLGMIVVVIAIAGYMYYDKNRPGSLDGFARCIEESGAKFYGAFWCPHCQDQKEMFGNSERLLPYIECSTANGQGTTVACQQDGITSYPTWQYPDGSREVGVQTLSILAEKTGCELPASN